MYGRGKGRPRGPISPVLANIYLHYVLDLWFEKRFKKWCQGEAYLTRFCDDFVVCFQYKRDVERLDRYLMERMGEFGLELAREKTKILLFGRFAREGKAAYGEKPERFESLGFKHVCGIDRNGITRVLPVLRNSAHDAETLLDNCGGAAPVTWCNSPMWPT